MLNGRAVECQPFEGRLRWQRGARRGRGLWCVPTLTGFAVEELSLDVCLLVCSRDLLADTSPGNDQAKTSSLRLPYFMVTWPLEIPLLYMTEKRDTFVLPGGVSSKDTAVIAAHYPGGGDEPALSIHSLPNVPNGMRHSPLWPLWGSLSTPHGTCRSLVIADS